MTPTDRPERGPRELAAEWRERLRSIDEAREDGEAALACGEEQDFVYESRDEIIAALERAAEVERERDVSAEVNAKMSERIVALEAQLATAQQSLRERETDAEVKGMRILINRIRRLLLHTKPSTLDLLPFEFKEMLPFVTEADDLEWLAALREDARRAEKGAGDDE